MVEELNPSARSTAWHALPPEFVFARQKTDPEAGLSGAEAARRLAESGPNRIDPGAQPARWQEFRARLGDPQIFIGLVTGAAFAILGETAAAALTWLATLALGALQVLQNRNAQRALEALQALNEPGAIVRRSGRRRLIPADEVVPGDLILLEAGQRVPADARLVQAHSLQTDESILSGDSQPVDKTTDAPLADNTPLVQRVTMVYGGTLVLRGQGDAVVTATGSAAESGLGAAYRPLAAPRPTQMQNLLRALGRYLVAAALVVSAMLIMLAALRTGPTLEGSLLTWLAVVFASLPGIGLLAINVLLALGAYRIARQHAILRSLVDLEKLASVDTVMTEKSGLLTSNQLELRRSVPAIWQPQLLEIGVMSTGIDLGRFQLRTPRSSPAGELPDLRGTDPIDAAILQAAAAQGLDILGLRTNRPVVEVFTFDGQRRRMSIVYRRGARPFVAVKGDPEAVLGVCARRWTSDGIDQLTPVDRQAILETAQALAAGGGRVIALAERALNLSNAHVTLSPEEAERDLNFAGFMAFSDALRPETPEAIQICHQAGIQILLVTGDHPAAAQATAEQSSLAYREIPVSGTELDWLDKARMAEALAEHHIFARITPIQKLRLVKALQAGGARVAITGDDPRDTLALAAADLGAALGQRGTDAARAAAGMTLADDSFATLVKALIAGRLLYHRIGHMLGLYLACKLGFISAISLPLLAALPLPFTPLQIILAGAALEALVAITLVSEPANGQVNQIHPHNPKEPLFDVPMQARIFRGAVGLFAALTIAYLSSLLITGDLPRAQTTAFVTWLLTYVLLAYSLHSDTRLILQQNWRANRVLWISALGLIVFALAATNLPVLQALLGTHSLQPLDWGLVLLAAGVGTILAELRKWLGNLRPTGSGG